ncbi:MAG: PEP-CTERM sorting domain-containing protein [Armatimonadetes bacterium]|nr:PEP-CTERM sorting domain-containing protein [Armatimonadota bacterium]
MGNKKLQLTVVGLLLGSIALADDLNPPPWRGSNASATTQEWDFTTGNSPIAPDGNTWGSGGGGYVNPFGVPQFLGATGGWNANKLGRQGVWDMTSMDFLIPNDGSGPQDHKDLWIQISYLAQGTNFSPDVYVQSANFQGQLVNTNTILMADGWFHSTYQITMTECPPFERIHFNSTSPVIMAVDEVVIDTYCYPVPEPCSLVALGIGGAALMVRRRFRR